MEQMSGNKLIPHCEVKCQNPGNSTRQLMSVELKE